MLRKFFIFSQKRLNEIFLLSAFLSLSSCKSLIKFQKEFPLVQIGDEKRLGLFSVRGKSETLADNILLNDIFFTNLVKRNKHVEHDGRMRYALGEKLYESLKQNGSDTSTNLESFRLAFSKVELPYDFIVILKMRQNTLSESESNSKNDQQEVIFKYCSRRSVEIDLFIYDVAGRSFRSMGTGANYEEACRQDKAPGPKSTRPGDMLVSALIDSTGINNWSRFPEPPNLKGTLTPISVELAKAIFPKEPRY